MWESVVRRPLRLLKTAPRELWLVYVLKALDSYGYFALSEVFTMLLSDEFGVSDTVAGAVYGGWGTAITLYGILTGTLIDAMGVRTSLVASYALQTASRLVLVYTRSISLAYAVIFFVQPLASSWGAPVLTIAIKRLVRDADRTVSFGLFYAMMNVAALLSGFAIDALRLGLPRGISSDESSPLASPVRVVVLSTVATSLGALCVSWRFRDLPHRGDGGGGGVTVVTAGGVGAVSAWRTQCAENARGVLRNRRFWQFLAMAVFTLNLKQIFRHMDATFPKYAVRAFGCDAPFGSIYAINPAMIILGVPVVAAATPNVRHFDMIFRGGWITALSPFILAWSQTYAGACAFVTVLSLGEMVWSPRWYDYTMACAPPGKEGVFGALALAPVFAAKLPTGLLGGYLLQTHCPAAPGGDCPAPGRAAVNGGEGVDGVDGGEVGTRCDGRALWGTIGLVTLTSPVLIAVFHRWLRDSGDGDGETDGETGGGGDDDGFVRRAVVGGKTYERLERAEEDGGRTAWGGGVESDGDDSKIELAAMGASAAESSVR